MMNIIEKALGAVTVAFALFPSVLFGDPGAGGTQSGAAARSQNVSDITAGAAADSSSIYIRWSDTVEVRRGERTIENINREEGAAVVHGVTGAVEKVGNSVTYIPSGRPSLRCPSTSDPEIFGPCRLG